MPAGWLAENKELTVQPPHGPDDSVWIDGALLRPGADYESEHAFSQAFSAAGVTRASLAGMDRSMSHDCVMLHCRTISSRKERFSSLLSRTKLQSGRTAARTLACHALDDIAAPAMVPLPRLCHKRFADEFLGLMLPQSGVALPMPPQNRNSVHCCGKSQNVWQTRRWGGQMRGCGKEKPRQTRGPGEACVVTSYSVAEDQARQYFFRRAAAR